MADENVSEIKVDYDKICEQLSDLVINDDDFKILSQEMDVYCPFEALKVSGLEIRHSNFLEDILKPLNPHGFGDHILRKVTETLLQEANMRHLALKLHFSDLSNVEITREWKKDNKESLDLLIRIPDIDNGELIIAIEIKVKAKEGKDQLERYEKAVNEEWKDAKKVFIFLTMEGDKPSRDKWVAVNFETIIKALQNVIVEHKGDAAASMMVQCYINMVKREHLEDLGEIEELAEKIWGKHKIALNYLIKNKESIKKEDVEASIWEKHEAVLEFLKKRNSTEIESIIKVLRDKNFTEKVNKALDEKCTISTIEKSRSRLGVGFKIDEWGKYNDLKVSTKYEQIISLHIGFKYNKCVLRLLLVPGDVDARQKVYNIFLRNNLLKKIKLNITDEWTLLHSEEIRNSDKFKSLIDKFDENKKEQLIDDIIAKIIKVIPRYHEAIIEAVEKGEIE